MGARSTGVAALAVALLLAGCGGGDDDKASTPTPNPTETAGGSGESTATPTPTATAGESVAEGQGSADGGRFVFRIVELKRSGPTVVLNAEVSLAAGSESDSIQIASTFGDGIFQSLEDSPSDESGDVFDGIALIDPEGRKKYLVARDETGRCVCSNDLGAAFVKEDAPVDLEATLAAPPETVTQVNVVVPRVKTFTDVPIA